MKNETRYGFNGIYFQYGSEQELIDTLSKCGTLKEGLPYYSREQSSIGLLNKFSRSLVIGLLGENEMLVSHNEVNRRDDELLAFIKPWAADNFGKIRKHAVTAEQCKQDKAYWVWLLGFTKKDAVPIEADSEYEAVCIWADNPEFDLGTPCEIMVSYGGKETQLTLHRTCTYTATGTSL